VKLLYEERTIVEVIENRAKALPDHVAVIYNDEELLLKSLIIELIRWQPSLCKWGLRRLTGLL
jgi:hypothetical protein